MTAMRIRGESGLADSTSWALMVPILLTVVFATVAGGTWLHARNGASAAAAVAADEAANRDSDLDAARAIARDISTSSGLTDVKVTIALHQDSVTVTITGRVAQPIDFGWGQIREEAVRPREVVTRP